MRHVSDEERRARLGARHALAPSAQVGTALAATEAVAVLHATEPATVFLSCWARVPGITVEDIERELYVERTLVKQLAMRRTVFAFPPDLLAAALPSAAARTAGMERSSMAKDLVAAGITDDGLGWLDRARSEVLAVLDRTPDGLTAAEIRQAVPHIDVKVEFPKRWWSSPRVLTYLGAEGDIARGTNTGHWRTVRPRWTRMDRWLGGALPAGSSADGYRELVRRWLASFGPGTEDDLVWWLGSTKGVVRTALAELEAVEVSLDGEQRGWLLPDDLDEVPASDPWVALLPVLDPTVMGWKGRGFLLGPHGPQLFDRNGNAGTTALADGRAVGCWVQDPDGAVAVRLLEPVDVDTQARLADEAARLTAWLDGTVVNTVYRSPAMLAPSR